MVYGICSLRLLITTEECQIEIVYVHLISLNFVHQVAEFWQAAEADHGFALLTSQTFHFGQRHASQDDLLTTQEVLELYIIWGLTAKVRLK